MGPKETLNEIVNDTVVFELNCSGNLQRLQFRYDFGDGSPPKILPTPRSQHTYKKPGRYTVLTKASDPDGVVQRFQVNVVVRRSKNLKAHPASGPMTMSTSGNTFYVSNSDQNTVSAFSTDPIKKQWEKPGGSEPQGIAYDSRREKLWVCSRKEGAIRVLDPKTGTIEASIQLHFASQPYGIIYDPVSDRFYVSLSAKGEVVSIDPQSGSITQRVKVFSDVRSLSFDLNRSILYAGRFISGQKFGEVAAIDVSEFSSPRYVQLKHDPGPDEDLSGRGIPNYLQAIAIAPDGYRLWAVAKKDNVKRGLARDGLPLSFETAVRSIITQIDLVKSEEAFDERRDVDDRSLLSAVAFHPSGDYAFVASLGSNTIDMLDVYNGNTINSYEPDPEEMPRLPGRKSGRVGTERHLGPRR